MGFIINQGNHSAVEEKTFGDFKPIVKDGVWGRIAAIKPHKFFDRTLEVEIHIFNDEEYNGRRVWYTCPYDPTDEFAWKYKNLRRNAGCPYNPDEGASVDIEVLLLNKAVYMNLSARQDKKDKNKQHQNIAFKDKPKAEDQAEVVTEQEVQDKLAAIGIEDTKVVIEADALDHVTEANASDDIDW